MCQALMELMKDEVQEERDKVTTDYIRNLMDSMNLSAEEAMEALRVPEERRKVFIVKL